MTQRRSQPLDLLHQSGYQSSQLEPQTHMSYRPVVALWEPLWRLCAHPASQHLNNGSHFV